MSRKTLIETTNHQSGTTISIIEVKGERPDTFWLLTQKGGTRETVTGFTDFSQIETRYFKDVLELLAQIREDE